MRRRIAQLAVCAMAFLAAPLLAQEGVPQATGSVETTTPSQVVSPVQVTGTVNALASDFIEVEVQQVVARLPEVKSALEGTIVGLALDASTEVPAGLKLRDRVDLWFNEIAGNRVVTRIALAPLPVGAATAAAAPADSGAPVKPAPEQSAQAPVAPVSHQPEAVQAPEVQAPVVVVSAKKAAVETKPATGLPVQSATSPEAASAAGTTSATAIQPKSEAGAASQAPAAGSDLDSAFTTPPSSSVPASVPNIEVQTNPGGRGLVTVAIGLAALAILVILGVTLRRKQAVVGLGLSPSGAGR